MHDIMAQAADIFRVAQPHEYQKKFLESKTRLDGRELTEFREAVLSVGSISTADGSALVSVGDTKVVCGIKAELAPPKPEAPSIGYIVPNVDLPPLASPYFKSGPPSDVAQAATQFMLDVVLRSQCIQLEDLCVAEGKMSWVLYCDLICLNYDGNLLDACTLALFAALCNVKLPVAYLNEETGMIEVDGDRKVPLKVKSKPVAVTFLVFEKDTILVDPTCEEEKQGSAAVTVVTSSPAEKLQQDKGKICLIHKIGGRGLSETQLQDCISIIHNHAPDVLSLVEAAML